MCRPGQSYRLLSIFGKSLSPAAAPEPERQPRKKHGNMHRMQTQTGVGGFAIFLFSFLLICSLLGQREPAFAATSDQLNPSRTRKPAVSACQGQLGHELMLPIRPRETRKKDMERERERGRGSELGGVRGEAACQLIVGMTSRLAGDRVAAKKIETASTEVCVSFDVGFLYCQLQLTADHNIRNTSPYLPLTIRLTISLLQLSLYSSLHSTA
ncbi:unnamed protein product [Pleuronectes platessa]|uniref:Transmembrane protein n=1 Tax=Pleuronectes platessa TaxID=8262 RepID=A0A9N7Z3L9_PLEPL|nr:unnamed protein product [Pleuronectes platessa]